MTLRNIVPALLISSAGLALVACGGAEPPPPVPPMSKGPPVAPAQTTSAAEAPPPTTPKEIAAEDNKKAEQAKELAADKAKWAEVHKAEVARWTPETHTEAKNLVDKTFPDSKSQLKAITTSKLRQPANAARDKYRHPIETISFFGIQPNQSVIDIGPGEGWYTEILAPYLAKKGHYYATGGNPNGPATERSTFYANRFKEFLETSPEAYGKVESIVVDGKAPKLEAQGTIDAVLIMRGVHGMKNNGTFDAWLAEIHHALKPNGVLGIEEHRAAANADPNESAKKGYVPEKWVIDTVQAAGFKLAGKSEINANPKDTKDYAEGVWTLPPTLKLGDKDKDKYTAIGESDRMTLKFVKVAKSAPKSDAPKADAPKGDAPKGEKPATPAAPKP